MAAIYGSIRYQTGALNRKTKALTIALAAENRYVHAVNCLTSQEIRVLVLVLSLLAVGGLVKVYRAAHPPVTVNLPAKS
jgi:hypothetical protein